MTRQETLLLQALGPPWKHNLAIKTKRSRNSGYPSNYKVDLGREDLKLAIEIDGEGHRNPKALLLDAKKQNLLVSLRWRVLRFWNAEIDQDINKVVQTINSCIASL